MPFEFLHGAQGGGWIIKGKIKEKFAAKGNQLKLTLIGMYIYVQLNTWFCVSLSRLFDQYDSMAYPETMTKTKTVFFKVWDVLKDAVGQGCFDDELVVPEHSSMQSKMLEVYVEEYWKVLVNCNLSSQCNIVHISSKIEHIFRQLYAPLISTYTFPRIAWGLDKVHILQNYIKDIFFVTVVVHNNYLVAWGGQTTARMGSQECGGQWEENGFGYYTRIYLLSDHSSQYPQSGHWGHWSDSLSSSLWPDLEHPKCADLDVVLSFIPGAQRKSISDAIIGFCNHLLHQKLLNSRYWLFVIPLVHNSTGTSKPFQKPELDPHKMVWSDRSLGLNHVHVQKETNNKQIGWIYMYYIVQSSHSIMLLSICVL